MLTREEILEAADNRMDLYLISPEILEYLNGTAGGDFAKAQDEQYANIVKGVDLFMTTGTPVEISYEGKIHNTTVTAFGYEPDSEFFKIICRDKTVFRFRTFGFSSLGATGSYYGIVNDPDKKTGIRYLNFE
ncbi:MAG: hypothetical protein LBT43_08940 [Prevotella sp.]|jgi:hypothetical protein|nr:hypothetical protein [Prevotella sp.]